MISLQFSNNHMLKSHVYCDVSNWNSSAAASLASHVDTKRLKCSKCSGTNSRPNLRFVRIGWVSIRFEFQIIDLRNCLRNYLKGIDAPMALVVENPNYQTISS